MTNQETAFQQVSKLVNDFKANESKHLSPDYSEADVRKDFIDKFFDALLLAPNYREVKFYVEAKKPFRNLNNINKINSLVTQIIETKKTLYASKTESQKEYLEMKCSSLDKQIDEYVYELYGLTEEEIDIVEKSSH